MLLSVGLLVNVLEADEATGIPRAELLRAAGLEDLDLGKGKIEWATFVRVLAQLDRAVDYDVERMREIGRRMTQVPSYAARRIAANVVSVRALYVMADRWIGPVNFPHVRNFMRFRGNKVVWHLEIPRSYPASEPFLQLTVGTLTTLPEVIGLERAKLVECEVEPRRLDLVAELPSSSSVLDRVRRTARALLGGPRERQILEAQRDELGDSMAALQRGREEQRALLERLPDMVLVHVGGKVVWANRACQKTLGWDRSEDLAGKSLLDIVAPAYHVLVVERMRGPTDGGELHTLTECVLLTREGDSVVVEVAPTQAVVFDGVPSRLLVARDVTERVRMQQRLLVADRLASVGLLAAGVAHEVNNPLAYVLNNIEIARKELVELGPGAQQSLQALSVALEGVDRIRLIVRDLLLLSRGDKGPVGSVDVQAVARSTLALASHEVERTTRLVQRYEETPPVRASEARLAQVMLNLVANALEAMRGRPRDENELVVRIGRADEPGWVELTVSDTGTGIAEADLGRVFDPFFTTKPAGQGTGLGLAIAQRLVVEIGGDISVASRPGGGTTFRVLLPALGAPPEEDPPSGGPAPRKSNLHGVAMG